ncbi:hypothetical protein [Acidipropionibacterium acidipropionici]|uniref:hypothetical protein n=1 Tax=Acidipropionibacterium acidipropionici TaxID=1748 RepID=UPI00110A70CA|nr:hypothetical protein [Acidipropionibacterium acidipropionici]QCV93946.1 hypothetical protein FEZ30_00470 [Acidipropionibacterium acidipropionici]
MVEKYQAGDQIDVLLDLLALSECLEGCVIRDTYTVSDELNGALQAATAEGKRVRLDLSNPDLSKRFGDSGAPKPNDANLMNLLELFYNDLLLDLDKTDPWAVAQAISHQVIDRKILFPFIFGRNLYDALNTEHKKEIRRLSPEDSVRLLERTPIGVVQMRGFLFGPLGVSRTAHFRNIAPRRDLRLQHSADRSVSAPHRVYLESSSQARVNRFRALHREKLEKHAERSDWSLFLQKVTKSRLDDFDESSVAMIPHLIGDALDDGELRSLVESLHCADQKVIESAIERDGLSISRDRDGALGSHDRSELMQIMLLYPDQDIRASLDDLVDRGKIEIPEGEVRRPVLHGKRYGGQWATYVEVSSLGTRVAAHFHGMPTLRLLELLSECSAQCGASYRAQVAWQLRIGNDDIEREVERFCRSNSPSAVIRSLIVSIESCHDIVRERLGESVLDPDCSDEHCVSRIMWQLGFTCSPPRTVQSEYSSKYSELQSDMGALFGMEQPTDSIRSAAMGFLVELENYLRSIVHYVSWLLLTDHFNDESGLRYTPDTSMRECARLIYSDDLNKCQKMTLGEVPSRLGAVLNKLKPILEGRTDVARNLDEIPRFATETKLQKFPYRSTVLFGDLSGDSQRRVFDQIKILRKVLVDTQISEIRNRLSHPTNIPPTVEEVTAATSQVDAAISEIEKSGLAPVPWDYIGARVDRWGRACDSFIGPRNAAFDEYSPSVIEISRGPEGSLVIPCQGLVLDGTRDVVHVTYGFDSAYSKYWAGFPVRPMFDAARLEKR